MSEGTSPGVTTRASAARAARPVELDRSCPSAGSVDLLSDSGVTWLTELLAVELSVWHPWWVSISKDVKEDFVVCVTAKM
eukprot:CAMPEP_0177657756 /NCGR_PEP_ID=MMETSP0447-20121125/16390_1 /TAXON_ID=0 /ORGANISM="Stygamoeba regulata, Strain BSH-02190019" /LENGTH=79 /DNA_ID=CAMNT_0019162203 /DNA_START=114 /DNA_END=350 /DNA_ORIENTATION=+